MDDDLRNLRYGSPEWEAERQRIVERNRIDGAVLATELRALGFDVDSPCDLFNRRLAYQKAIPTLLAWLPKMDNLDIKECIVRALSVRWAKQIAANPLIAEFRRYAGQDDSIGWAIANALDVVADDSVFHDIAEVALDRRYGRDREMLALALGKMHNPRAVDVLIQLLSDPDVAGHAVQALAKQRSVKALPCLEPFLNHKEAWVRNAAKKAIAGAMLEGGSSGAKKRRTLTDSQMRLPAGDADSAS